MFSPWLGRGCARSTKTGLNRPQLFTDLIILRVPLHKQACAQARDASLHDTRALRREETAESYIFKLRLPGLKKEDLNIQIEDRTLHISYNGEPEAEGEEGEASSSNSQSKETKSGSCSFKRKLLLPESADVEKIKADVDSDTLAITVPKLPRKFPKVRRIDMKSELGSPGL